MVETKVRKRVTPPTGWLKQDRTHAVAAMLGVELTPDGLRFLESLSPDPVQFYRAESFRRAYWRAEMFSKFPCKGNEEARRDTAITAFLAAESGCAESNHRLVDLWSRTDIPEGIRTVLWKARWYLAKLFEGFSLDEVVRDARWGPGSSTSLPARFATPQTKWVGASHITEDCIPYLHAFVAWTGWVCTTDPVVTPGNMVTFVPKNAKTDRSIAIEPDWNMFFQLGLGGAIRRRLQRVGLLKPNAQAIHQVLAKNASQDQFLATVDLRGASDSIALALCEALLPQSVFEHVLRLRSQFGTLDEGKTWFPYEKVSSMGNGFTFELETALFWAVSKAVAGHASVYGDDIVVPSSSVGFLREVLSYVGFEFNEKKSHYGPSKFRESCGGHFFDGHDVTPLYVRSPLKGIELIAWANNLREKICGQTMVEFQAVYSEATRNIPRIFWGPDGVEGVLQRYWDEARPRYDRKRQSWTGLRLLRKYKSQPALELGALRHWVWNSRSRIDDRMPHLPVGEPPEYRWHRSPGIARDVIAVWYSDKWADWNSVLPPQSQK